MDKEMNEDITVPDCNVGVDHQQNEVTEDVSDEKEKKGKTVIKKEEATNLFKEHRGEGDAHHYDKADTREPLITAQDTSDSNIRDKVQDEATPEVDVLNSPDEEVSEEEENTQGDNTKQPEPKDDQQQEFDQQQENSKTGKSDVVDHASSQETSQVQSPLEKSVIDVSDEKEKKGKTVIKKEEATNLFKEHRGEGDAHHYDKADTREPLITAQDTSDSKSPFIYACGVLVVAVLAYWLLRAGPSPVQKPFNLLEVFRQEMDKVESGFPSQHKELWRRSRIHLLRHLNMSQPSEPVSLILTSGHGAKKTLGCLAQQLAAAFSTARNASALDIDGTSKTTEDSDQVKLDIDKALKEAFDGGKQAVVIHRFEELPPGSTLIFYRYCDHENAAYKNVFLAFTVLLEEELEPSPNLSLGMVEEIVQEYLKEKFVSSDRTAVFNQMDVDKLSGLWSRISHLILPVSAEERIELHGCGG